MEEKRVSCIVTSISESELILEDGNKMNYLIQKSDFDFTKNQLKMKDQIVVTFKGEISEISPAKFKKVIDAKKRE